MVVGSSRTGPTISLRSWLTSADYSSPRAKRLDVRWLEAMLLETPSHPTGPTIYLDNSSKAARRTGRACPPVAPPSPRAPPQTLPLLAGKESGSAALNQPRTPLRNSSVYSCSCRVSKVSEKDLQDQQCEYSPQALPEPTSTISCLQNRFLDDQLLPTPHLYFLYFSGCHMGEFLFPF